MFLAAVIPPNNAYTAFLEFKRGLFSATSALSSWALLPMVPFLFTKNEPAVLKRKMLPKLPGQGIAFDEVVIRKGQCLLSSSGCLEFCDNLSPLFDGYDPSPGLCGLHLFDTADCAVKSADIEAAVQSFDKSVLHWQSSSIAVFKTENYLFNEPDAAVPGGWAARIELETLYEIRFQREESP